MKVNMPVTDHEVFYSDEDLLVSKTDLKGQITYVNQSFIEVSGFTESELLGQSHNIVRHPDMPPEAYADLWDTLKKGKPWTGMVKNRCKNGDFYWVEANVTPMFNDGKVTEYISVRRKPSRQEIKNAEALYMRLKGNRHLIGEGRVLSGLQRINRKLFGHFKLIHKLASIGLGVVLLAAMVISSNLEKFEEIEHLEDELLGVQAVSSVKQLLNHMPKHRGLSQVLLKGDSSVAPRIAKQKQGVDDVFKRLNDLATTLPDHILQQSKIKSLQTEWEGIAARNASLAPAESFKQHTVLLKKILNLLVTIGIDSGLSKDQHAGASFLISAFTRDIPFVSEKIGQARGLGSGVIASGNISSEQLGKLRVLETYIQVSFENIESSIGQAKRSNAGIQSAIGAEAKAALQETKAFIRDIDRLSRNDLTFKKPTEFFSAGTAAISANFKLFDRIESLITEELQQDLRSTTSKLYLSLLLNGLVITIVLGVIITVSRSLFIAVRQATENAKSISSGNYNNVFEITGTDELSQMLFALKSMQIRQGFEVQEAQRKAEETARIKSALDVCSTNVVVTGEKGSVIYLNDSAREMFNAAESAIKQEIPAFDSRSILGMSSESFYKETAQAKATLETLSQTLTTTQELGGRTLTSVATPVLGEKNERLGVVLEWKDETEYLEKQREERRIANQNARMKQALDSVSANVMVADDDLNIIYMNKALESSFRTNEAAMKQDLPHFSVDSLIGSNIDVFHKNPSHQRAMLSSLTAQYDAKIIIGERNMDLVVNPIINEAGERIGTVVEWADRTEELARIAEEKRVADENARIKQALDNVSANVMVADKDSQIIYLNEALKATFSQAESAIRKDIKDFSVMKLQGSSISLFSQNPAMSLSAIEKLSNEDRSSMKVGGRHLDVVMNPILNEQRQRIGTVVEWNDRTTEVGIENEVDALVFAAANGDLSKRIDPEGKTGFFSKLAEGLNQTVGSADSFLKDLGSVLSAMAGGDLSRSMTADYQGAFGDLKNDLNAMVAKLTEVITQIRETSSMVSEAATEISQGNADLSARTESQASSLEETASSMEEITVTVKESAEGAQKANEVSRAARSKAVEGGEIVEGAINSMKEILASSNKISDIIGVIDEIAFQTNLLALNAAVEAARAGEHGRGFAVVAGEVRTLSQRSASAAKEIKDLIRESVMKVESGSTMVNQSGATLAEIVQAVEEVARRVDAIATAANEQTDGIGQINQAIGQMDNMTQQNAALVEEASASSEAMAEQASSLSRVVSFFSLDNSLVSTPAPIATPYTSPEPVAPVEVEPKPVVPEVKPEQVKEAPSPQVQKNDANDIAPSEDQVIKYGTGNYDDDDEWEDF